MIEKILKSFFIKKIKRKKSDCITVIGNYRERKIEVLKKESVSAEKTIRKTETCLSDYFMNLSGLNTAERKFYNMRLNGCNRL